MRILVGVIGCVLLLGPGRAGAQFVVRPATVVRAADAPARALEAVHDGAGLAATDTCAPQPAVAGCSIAVTVPDTLALTGCDAALGLTTDAPPAATLPVRCTHADGTHIDVRVGWQLGTDSLTLVDGALSVNSSDAPATWQVIVPSAGDVWTRYDRLSGTDLRPLAGLFVFYSSDGDAWSAARVTIDEAHEERRDEDSGCGGDVAAIRAECQNQARALHYVHYACYVNEPGSDDLMLVYASDTSHIIPPNVPYGVLVRAPAGRTFEASMSGTIGITEPEWDRITGSTTSDGDPPGAAADRCVWTPASFGPRRAGTALQLSVALREDRNTLDTELRELIVEQRYWGALRIGVGVPFLAVDRAYSIEPVGGGMQPEIVARGSVADVELIVAFSGFLVEGGRSYQDTNLWHRFGLFVAAGVLSASQRGAQFLTSVYLGIEFEIMRSFTVGVAGLLRRVQRLGDDYFIGQAVPLGTTIAGEEWEPGIGLVLCVSPEFLQFAGGIE